jgi:hypothetical protein
VAKINALICFYRVSLIYEFLISKSSIIAAPYVGFLDRDAPTFGDIAVLAKGKLKKNADQSMSFEQINERCDEKCQINADKYLENVAALWMVERIRHRDPSTNSHRYDLKFTIIPIIHEHRQQIDHNILENRLRHHTKKTFILRDSDYPSFFRQNSNRRGDLFSPNIERSISDFMNINPNSLMQNLFGFNAQQSPSPPQKLKQHMKDTRLNKGEFYMAPKILNIPKHPVNFHPAVNGHAAQSHAERHVRFPDSREMMINKPPVMNFYRPKPEIYNRPNAVDYRGTNDNVYVGTNEHQNVQSHQQPMTVPVFSIPVDMPMIQLGQMPYAIPFQIQLSTPNSNPQIGLFPHPNEVTTFRYQPQLIGLSNRQQSPPQLPAFNHYLPLHLLPTNNASTPFQESERHTISNFYSPPDPVYHPQQSTSEAPIQPTTYSPRSNNYANIIRHQIETPAISTASSRQVNQVVDDNEFMPVTPSYDVRKHQQLKNSYKFPTTRKPNSINDQLEDVFPMNFTVQSTTAAVREESEKENEIPSYQVVVGRPKVPFRFSETTTEKPVIKWLPKNKRNKLANLTTATPSTTEETHKSFIPTLIPIETTTTTQSSTRLTTAHIFRGRNRYNKRNSTSHGKAATISPQSTTKTLRKKTSSAAPSTPTPFSTSIFPTYITPATDELITSQSLSTSISLEVNGERVYDQQTTTPGYELVPVGVESIVTNTTNVKLFKASVVPETFDDLTLSILNHAKTIHSKKDEN